MCLTCGLSSCWELWCQFLGESLLLVSCLYPVNSSFIKLFSVKLFDSANIFCWDTAWYKEHTGTKMLRNFSDELHQKRSSCFCLCSIIFFFKLPDIVF